MKLREWIYLEDGEKKIEIIGNGKGLKYNDMLDSIEYIDHVINRLYEVKYVLRLPRYGMKAVSEHLRWQSTTEDGSKLFKVNNNLTADINHWLLRTFPELQGFLSCRYKS